MKRIEYVCLGMPKCGISLVAQCRCSMLRGYHPDACLVIGKAHWVEAKAADTHNKRSRKPVRRASGAR